MEKIKNEELISIYRNFCTQCVTYSHELIRDEISSLSTIRFRNDSKDLFNKLREYFKNVDFRSFNMSDRKSVV